MGEAAAVGRSEEARDDDSIPLSALQHAVYCLRQAALIHLERREPEDSSEGSRSLQPPDPPYLFCGWLSADEKQPRSKSRPSRRGVDRNRTGGGSHVKNRMWAEHRFTEWNRTALAREGCGPSRRGAPDQDRLLSAEPPVQRQAVRPQDEHLCGGIPHRWRMHRCTNAVGAGHWRQLVRRWVRPAATGFVAEKPQSDYISINRSVDRP
jgi:hypothetical protein